MVDFTKLTRQVPQVSGLHQQVTSRQLGSACLLRFLIAWQGWAINDAPKTKYFCKTFGLCSNLSLWLREHDEIDNHTAWYADKLLKEKLRRDYPADPSYPFTAYPSNYNIETAYGTHHRNPHRLAWVGSIITELALVGETKKGKPDDKTT